MKEINRKYPGLYWKGIIRCVDEHEEEAFKSIFDCYKNDNLPFLEDRISEPQKTKDALYFFQNSNNLNE